MEQLNTSGAGGSNALWFLMWSKLLELPDLPTAVTLSAGYCEEYIKRHVGAETFSLWDSVFARVGLAGVSAVAAAGDTGSTSCQRDDPKNKKLSVAAPASSPHITAVGGSHIALNPDNTRSDEVVWNDGRAGEQEPAAAPRSMTAPGIRTVRSGRAPVAACRTYR